MPRWHGFVYRRFDYASVSSAPERRRQRRRVRLETGHRRRRDRPRAGRRATVSERRAVGRRRLLLPRAAAHGGPDTGNRGAVGADVGGRHAGVDAPADVRVSRRGSPRIRRAAQCGRDAGRLRRRQRSGGCPRGRVSADRACRGRAARWRRIASRPRGRLARTTGRIKRCCRISCTAPDTHSSRTPGAAWASGRSATGGSTTTSASTCPPACMLERVCRDDPRSEHRRRNAVRGHEGTKSR